MVSVGSPVSVLMVSENAFQLCLGNLLMLVQGLYVFCCIKDVLLIAVVLFTYVGLDSNPMKTSSTHFICSM